MEFKEHNKEFLSRFSDPAENSDDARARSGWERQTRACSGERCSRLLERASLGEEVQGIPGSFLAIRDTVFDKTDLVEVASQTSTDTHAVR